MWKKEKRIRCICIFKTKTKGKILVEFLLVRRTSGGLPANFRRFFGELPADFRRTSGGLPADFQRTSGDLPGTSNFRTVIICFNTDSPIIQRRKKCETVFVGMYSLVGPAISLHENTPSHLPRGL